MAVAIGMLSEPAHACAQDADRIAAVDFARLVPGDAGFYVEVKGLSSLRQRFQSLGVWQTLRDTVETPKATTQPWQRRSEQLLGMTSEQLIGRVLGHRAALFAKRSDDWQNGVLIAEIESCVAVRALLHDWRARPMANEGPVRRYLLGGNLLCAVLDRIIILGPPEDPDGLWGRSVLLLTGRGPHLAGQSEYASLRSRFDADADAVVFARWPNDYPYAFGDCERVLAVMNVENSVMRCRVLGRRRRASANEPIISKDLLGSTCDGSIAVWAGSLNNKAPNAEGDSLEPNGPGTLLQQLLAKLPNWGNGDGAISKSIEKSVLLQLGTSKAEETPFPTLTLSLRTKVPEKVVPQLDSVFELLAQLVAFFSRPDGATHEIPEIQHDRQGGIDVRHVPLGEFLARRDELAFLRPMELAWTASRSSIVIGTSKDAVYDTAKSNRLVNNGSSANPIESVLMRTCGESRQAIAEFGFIRGQSVSRMIDTWMEVAATQRPELLQDAWWQLWITGKLYEESRLGVGLQNDSTAPGRAIVKEVEITSPAASYLHVGDVIVGVFGKPLPREHAAQALARQYEQRGNVNAMTFDVLRNGKKVTIKIPVARPLQRYPTDLKPITALKRLSALLGGIDTAAYARIADDPTHLDVRVRIEWKAALTR